VLSANVTRARRPGCLWLPSQPVGGHLAGLRRGPLARADGHVPVRLEDLQLDRLGGRRLCDRDPEAIRPVADLVAGAVALVPLGLGDQAGVVADGVPPVSLGDHVPRLRLAGAGGPSVGAAAVQGAVGDGRGQALGPAVQVVDPLVDRQGQVRVVGFVVLVAAVHPGLPLTLGCDSILRFLACARYNLSHASQTVP